MTLSARDILRPTGREFSRSKNFRMTRQGVLVEPYQRLNQEQIELIHRESMTILRDPGIICFNRTAAELFGDHGAEVALIEAEGAPHWKLKIPEKTILDAAESAPSIIKLGARDERNAMILDAHEPRVRFASGSEANNWLEVEIETFTSKRDPSIEIEFPIFREERGNVQRLAKAAHLCEHMENWDSFLRTINIQDDDINDDNKDVNKFFASLNNTTKHVMSGLTEIAQLDNVVRMAEIIAGGEKELRANPIISFITCVVKSPLQFVDDSAAKAMEVVKKGLPLVLSSSPQGGSTAPIKEDGMVASINAEIMASVALAQLTNKGAPVLYGSVPTRARMDDLNESYGFPEFNQYNIDCVQMARFYSVPCYSTAGVSDGKVPGIQASVERLFSHILVALGGPQYLHYAFGLLERTNTFCPVQAVLDDAHIGMVKRFAAQPVVNEAEISDSLMQIRKVMATSHKLYVRYARNKIRSGEISSAYPFEGKGMIDETIIRAQERLEEVFALPRRGIDDATVDQIIQEVPGILERLRKDHV